VFNNSRVFAKSGVAVRAGSVLLGRAWRAFARVLFQNTEMSAIVNPEGWGAWYNTENTTMIYYAEFHNTGPGANTTGRVDWSYQLNGSVSIDYTMPDWKTWVDLEYWY
jgi:pectinesterase